MAPSAVVKIMFCKEGSFESKFGTYEVKTADWVLSHHEQ